MNKRKIEYIRNLQGSYMILVPKGALSPYEEKMLEHNKLPGLLMPFPGGRDGERTLWYDITGKQSLEMYLESRELDQEFLCRLLEEMCRVQEGLENLLLGENGLLLDAECIFIDRGNDSIEFGYCPGGEAQLPEKLQRFTEYLLTKINHRDSAAVEIAYGLYEKTLKGGCTPGDIRKGIKHAYPKEEAVQIPERTPEPEAATWENGKAADDDSEKNTPNARGSRRKVIGRHKDIVRENRKFTLKLSEQIRQRFDEWFGNGKVERKVQQEPFVFLPEKEEETKQIGQPTVLLSELTGKPRGILHYEGNGNGADIEIKKLPFIIGSEASCDGYIPSRAVSRQHARITETDGIYFIEDLNSSNGTWVGGEMLNYKMKISLQPNERIRFADETFRFL